MKMSSQQSRRLFFQTLTGLGAVLFGWSWYRLSQVEMDRELQAEFRHNADIPLGVSYFGKYYLVRNEKGVRAFSTTCTHAGCRIGTEHAGLLSCSCHGSQFEAETGHPVKGPAYKPLQELECQFDQQLSQWIIKLQPVAVVPS